MVVVFWVIACGACGVAGYGLRVWVELRRPVVAAAVRQAVGPGTGLLDLRLFGLHREHGLAAEVSRQTRRGEAYEAIVTKPHGAGTKSYYELVGEVEGIGVYRERV